MPLGKRSTERIRALLKESIVSFHYYSELDQLDQARECYGRVQALGEVRKELKIPFSVTEWNDAIDEGIAIARKERGDSK